MIRLTKILLLFISVILIVTAVSCKKKNGADSPNHIIFIVVDTLRADRLGTYGYKVKTSPGIDALAKDSVVFDNAYATAPWTLPSIGSMFTGAYPGVLGISGKYVRIDKNIETITERFKKKGFKTGAIVSHFLISKKFGFKKGFDRFDGKEGGRGQQYISSPGILKRALRFVRNFKSQRMFLFLHWFDPHYEYLMHEILNTHKNYKGKLGDDFLVQKIRKMGVENTLTKDDWRYLRARYDSEIRYTDHHIGKFFKELKRLGLYENSTIILVADHGEEIGEGEDRWIGHAKKLSRATLRVPLMIKLPKSAHKRRINNLVSLIDLGPTIAKLGGLPPLSGPGVSGKAWDLAKDIETPEVIFSETKRWAYKWALITDGWKIIFDKKEMKHKLFNLKSDLQETHNLANENIAMFETMNQKLQKVIGEIATQRRGLKIKKETVDLSADQLQQLKALGYME